MFSSQLNFTLLSANSVHEACAPLFPCWILRGRVDEPHVEEGREDEGEKGDGGAAHQVQEHGEVGHGGAHKQED